MSHTKAPADDVRIGSGLEIGSVHPAHKKGLKAHGLKQGPHTQTTSDGGSDLESLRQSGRPKSEAVRQAMHDGKAQKKAHHFNVRSEGGGAEKNGGW